VAFSAGTKIPGVPSERPPSIYVLSDIGKGGSYRWPIVAVDAASPNGSEIRFRFLCQ